MDTDSGLSLFSSLWNAYILPYVLELFAASIPLTCCCLHKLKRHKLMLDQMMHFDLKSAKCTLETDRIVLQQQVLNLFDEALQPPLSVEFSRESTPILSTDDTEEPLISPEDIRSIRPITSYPSKDEVIGEFNEYVRRTLRDSILDSMGKEESTSLKFCIAVCLPVAYMGLSTVLNCDGFGDCSVSAANLGYTSVSKYMISTALVSTFLFPLSMILSFPLMLRTNSLVYNMVSGTVSQVAMGSFVTALVLIATQSYASIQTVALVMAVEKESLCWFTAFLCLVALEFWAMYLLFRTKGHGETTSSWICRFFATKIQKRYEQMIRMIAQDFAGAAGVQCISGSFRSISDEFRMSDCQRISLCRPAAARKQEPWQKVHCNCFVAIRQRWKAKRNQNKCCSLSFKDPQNSLNGSLSSFCRSPIAIFTVAHLSAQLLLGQRNRVPSTRKHQADVVRGSKGLGH